MNHGEIAAVILETKWQSLFTRPGEVIPVLLLAAFALVATAPATTADDLQPLLDRATAYAGRFTGAFKDVLATEDYRQSVRTGGGRPLVRVTRADVLVMKVAGPVPWVTFRDVYEVDGQPVRNREARLERLLRDDPSSAVSAGRALIEESARYNLGPLHRTLNVPTLALSFLEPENRGRFTFRRSGQRKMAGVEAVEVVFDERVRPTLVRDDQGRDVPCKGRLWIGATDGAILRTEIEYANPARDDSGESSGSVVTVFRLEPKLGILVPVEMQERYEIQLSPISGRARPPTRTGERSSADHIEARAIRIQATARYSDYHRFEVKTEEWVRPEGTPDR